MALVLRNVKGSALTYSELDGNFTFITSSFVQNSLTSSMTAGSASYVVGDAYPGTGPAPQSFKFIAGKDITNGSTPSIATVNLISQLGAKTLGTDCFIVATATGSAGGTPQAIHVTSLTAGTVLFSSQDGQAVPFNFHIMYY